MAFSRFFTSEFNLALCMYNLLAVNIVLVYQHWTKGSETVASV